MSHLHVHKISYKPTTLEHLGPPKRQKDCQSLFVVVRSRPDTILDTLGATTLRAESEVAHVTVVTSPSQLDMVLVGMFQS